MSDGVILAVVAMVCVSIGGPVTLAIFLGRSFFGRATTSSIEVATGTGTSSGGEKPKGK